MATVGKETADIIIANKGTFPARSEEEENEDWDMVISYKSIFTGTTCYALVDEGTKIEDYQLHENIEILWRRND